MITGGATAILISIFLSDEDEALEEDSKIQMALIVPQILDEKGHWIDCHLHQHLSKSGN
jgi:hypothetical protein